MNGDDEPPWARPREDTVRPVTARRVREEGAEAERLARPPSDAAGPPAGPMPPPMPAEAAKVRQDPNVGLVTGPVTLSDRDCRFTVRAETGRHVVWTLRGVAPADVPRTGELVRVTPALWHRIRPGSARAVEVLAGLDGPVLRRITGHGLLTRVQWTALAVVAVLIVVAAAVLYRAF